MKPLSTLLIIFSVFAFSASGQSKLPNSYVNIGLGGGINYGIFGTKTVIGYRNSGLMIGLGVLPASNLLGYEIGAQLSHNSLYVNVGYGVFGTIRYNNEPEETMKAGNAIVGGMINIGAKKKAFVDIGIGHTFGAPTTYILREKVNNNVWTAIIGLGFRIGDGGK